ncbi:MAG TPA: SDR family oxidoreductase [Thermoleophilaceae bacterium]|jgi:NAD(P)-dependent dehydrogenase (short-subunit alcohol dehydrogenase family)
MDVAGRVVVVTGGASGIGRALARRFAAEGARGVAVADLDGAGAETVAAELGDVALGMACDVAVEAQVDDLLERTRSRFGPVDLFCANAGVGVGTELDTPDDVWDMAFDVNVRAHVLAARRLVPEWLERGEGYFLTTASAAGLLTQIGSAPYSVTKHAAVAFAEWLSVTYGDRGVRVSCLCPMGVNTGMLQAGLDLEGDEGLGTRVVAAAGEVLEPEQVADAVVDALREERFLVLPHPEVLEFFRRKGADYDRWLAGMRRLQARVTDPG